MISDTRGPAGFEPGRAAEGSKFEFRRELNNARPVGLLAQVDQPCRGIWREVVGVIERVEKVTLEEQPVSFPDREGLAQRQVLIPGVRPQVKVAGYRVDLVCDDVGVDYGPVRECDRDQIVV